MLSRSLSYNCTKSFTVQHIRTWFHCTVNVLNQCQEEFALDSKTVVSFMHSVLGLHFVFKYESALFSVMLPYSSKSFAILMAPSSVSFFSNYNLFLMLFSQSP